VLLSTCNRTEIYFFSEDLAETHSYLLSILRFDIGEDFDQKLYSYFGLDCFSHLSRVASGLDSAIVAETEIQGQVKTAYENALAYSLLPYELHYLFQKCLKIGKQVRSELPLKPGLPDLEHAILNAGFSIFDNPKDAKILCIGSSEINLKVISFLKNKDFKNITLCNRTAENALSIASKQQLSFLEWKYMHQWDEYDWIIFGTKSPEYLLKKEDLENKKLSQKLIIDLCVPRNVDPAISNHHQIHLLNIDQINRSLKIRRQSILETLVRAEQIVFEAARQQVELFHQREQHRLKFATA
jgi:glutamyl-tRNA reductase